MGKAISAKEYLNDFDVVTLQETWLEKDKEKESIKRLEKSFKWVSKAASRENAKGRASGGVLVGVKKGIRFKTIEEWKFGLIIKEIIIEKGKKVNIIVVYNNKGMKEVAEELKELVNELVIEGYSIILLGDFNARVGKWTLDEEGELREGRSSADEILNAEGRRLLELCEDIGGVIKNGNTRGDWEGNQTFVGGGGSSVLDLVIEVENERGSVIDELKVVPRIESDHLPVELLIRRKAEREDRRKKGREKEYKLKWEVELEVEYARKMGEKAKELGEQKGGAKDRWEKLIKNIWEVGKELRLVREQGGTVGEERDGDIKAQKRRVYEALKRWVRSRREEDRIDLGKEKVRLKETRKNKKEEFREKQRKRVENSKTMNEFWAAIRSYRPRRKRKGENIEKEKWVEHFRNLLGGEEGGEARVELEGGQEEGEEEGNEVMNREIGIDEVQRALASMKNRKAAGEDGVPVEFLKYLPREWVQEIAEILNEIFKGGEFIEGWKVARIFPIHKDGDEEEVKNYRGVSLLDSGYKLYTTILEKRLRFWMEKEGKVGESQAGFREKRGTRDHVFTLNSVINNKLKEKGGKLYACFIDFKTAFDAINRKKLIEKLRRMGIRGRMLKAIVKIYEETLNEVIAGEGLTDRFRTFKGVRQGCPLSVLLFLIFLEDLEDKWKEKNEGGTVIGRIKIFGLKFADDAVAIADTAEGLRSMIEDLERYSRNNEIMVNEKKTKIMVFRKGGRRRREKWFFAGKELEVVGDYKYLGFWFTTSNSYTKHIRKMTARVKKATNAIWGIWRRARIKTLEERLYLMDAIIKAGCFYGVEIWGWSVWEELERVQGRYVKMAMGVNRNTPSYIWEMEAGRSRLEIDSLKRAGKYILDIGKMKEDRWPRMCLREEVRSIRNNKATKWGEQVKKALEGVGDGESLDKFLVEGEREKLRKNIEKGARTKLDQGLQKNWGKIESSKYCRDYGEWKKEPGREKYWGRNNWSGETREQWARLRCGNLGREKSKGFKDDRCRLCNSEEENLEHIWRCRKARAEMEEEWVREIEELGLGKGGETTRRVQIEMLKGDPNESVCSYSKKFEVMARSSTEKGKERRIEEG